MELQINDLVSAIKKDGIETANKQAEEILSNAQKQADSIIENAKAEALKIKEASDKEIRIFRESAVLSAEQAKRDAVIAVRTELTEQFRKLLSENVGKALDDKLLAKLILAAAGGEDVSKYAVELQSVSEGLKAELAKELKNGLELRITKNAKKGIRLAAKDGSGYFDCSDEELTDMLMPFFRDIRL